MCTADWILKHTLCFLSVADVRSVLSCQRSLPPQIESYVWRQLLDRVAVSRSAHKSSLSVRIGPTHVCSVETELLRGGPHPDREVHSVLTQIGVVLEGA